MLLAAAIVTSLGLGLGVTSVAQAADYPSWSDVQNAKRNEKAKAAEIERIKGFISQLQAEVQAAQAVAEEAGTKFQAAQFKFDEADQRARDLEAAAAEAQAEADEAKRQAGFLAAQLYRSGGNDLSVNLLLNSNESDTEDLLYKLGNMSKLVERSSQIYEAAKQSENEAKSLLEQAEVAKVEREKLKVEAQAAFDAAVAAQKAVQSKLAATQSQRSTLEAQLADLQGVTAAVQEQFNQGIAAEAARRGVAISAAGWTKPSTGYISDYFGPRQSVWTGYGWSSSYHRGLDFGQSCGTPIYAASGGTVSYAGWYGSYGNFVMVDHGDGMTTAYAHIRNGGYNVGVGQDVGPGEVLAYTGTTGSSTGCHLHFETRVNGSAVNPIPFLQERGVGF